MMEMIKNVDFSEFNLTLIRVLKLIELFKEKNKYELGIKKIVLFDFYMRFPFMTNEEKEKQNFDDKYAFYFWKPNYSLYEAVLSILVAKDLISCENGVYRINENGEDVLNCMDCKYMKVISEAGCYVLNNVTKLSEKKIEEDIMAMTKY